MHFSIILQSTSGSSKLPFALKLKKNEISISPTLIQAPPVPIFLDLMTLTTVRKRLKLWSSSNMYLFPLLISSPFLGPSLSWNWFLTLQSRNILVGTVTRQRDRRSTNRGLILGRGETSFSSPQLLEQLWNSPSFPYSGYRWLSPGIRRLGREPDH